MRVDEVRDILVGCESNSKFIPESCVETLVTLETVISILDAIGCKSSVTIASTVVSKAKKTFALLAFVNKVEALEDLLAEGFADDTLPVAYEYTDSWAVKSIQRNSEQVHQGLRWRSFDEWLRPTVDYFCHLQWKFLAPVFRREQFHYFLHQDAILPFLPEHEDLAKYSYFSRVYPAKLHTSHQRVIDAVGSRSCHSREDET
jgi:hypothetical protein